MDVELRYRTELADQFIARLSELSPDQWRDVVSHHRNDNAYYRFALELVAEATQLLGGDRVVRYETTLADRTSRVGELVRESGSGLPADASSQAVSLATAAVHALLLRDSYGFNAGAFGELIRPFRPHVDLPDVERAATRSLTPPGVPGPSPPDRAPPVR